MTTQVVTKKQTINVYCCGGTGLNIGYKYLTQHAVARAGVADLNFYFLDTSEANLRSSMDEKNVYIVGKDAGIDGSAKVRRENADPILDSIDHILTLFPPATANLVLGSASGGTGSVIGPALVSELLLRGKIVFAAAVGSLDTRIEVLNTVRTLESYEKIAHDTQRPVPLFLEINDPTKNNSADAGINWIINTLALAVGALGIEGSGLDTADLRTLADVHRATSAKPQLLRAHVWLGPNPAPQDQLDKVISMLIMGTADKNIVQGVSPEYRATAEIPTSGIDTEYPYKWFDEQGPVGIYLSTGGFSEVHEQLTGSLDTTAAKNKARSTPDHPLLNSEKAKSSGKLVF